METTGANSAEQCNWARWMDVDMDIEKEKIRGRYKGDGNADGIADGILLKLEMSRYVS